MNESACLGFADANILADGILVASAKEEIFAEYSRTGDSAIVQQKIDDLFDSYAPAKPADTLFALVLPLPSALYGSHTIATSNLALLEAQSVMTEEYIDRRLAQRQHVFRRYSKSQRAKVHLTNEDVAQIYSGIMRFKFMLGKALLVKDEFDLHVAEVLITHFGCNARDAILVATAIKNGCPKFITRDNRLKRQLRRMKEIPIVSVQTVLDELGVRTLNLT